MRSHRVARAVQIAWSGVAGYLLGTIPSADVASRLARRGVDVRTAGTGNPGAANTAAVLGARWGVAVLIADISKGAVAAVTGRRIAGSAGAHVGSTAAVIGHCYPIWTRFSGGKGVATSAGQCLATFPAYFPLDLAVALSSARLRGRARATTLVASAAWVAGAFVWWRKDLPNAWGPPPSRGLVIAAAASSGIINLRFWQAARSSTPS